MFISGAIAEITAVGTGLFSMYNIWQAKLSEYQTRQDKIKAGRFEKNSYVVRTSYATVAFTIASVGAYFLTSNICKLSSSLFSEFSFYSGRPITCVLSAMTLYSATKLFSAWRTN